MVTSKFAVAFTKAVPTNDESNVVIAPFMPAIHTMAKQQDGMAGDEYKNATHTRTHAYRHERGSVTHIGILPTY
jgi:hypothetical protein